MGPFLKVGLLLLTGMAAAPLRADFDPTAPPRAPDAAAAALPTLSWVRLDGKGSIAWYGNTTVRLGERVEGGRIAAIREDHIVIAGPDGRRIVPLLDSQIRHQKVAVPQHRSLDRK